MTTPLQTFFIGKKTSKYKFYFWEVFLVEIIRKKAVFFSFDLVWSRDI